MIISIIAAIGKDRVIGTKNSLPWHLPADMKHFKKLTSWKPVIMGKATFESIGRPLLNRLNIVLSGDVGYEAPGCKVVHSVEDALKTAGEAKEVMILGGASVFTQFLPMTNKMYLTLIHHEFNGDSYFPEFKEEEWKEMSREDYKADEKNPYDFSFTTLERK